MSKPKQHGGLNVLHVLTAIIADETHLRQFPKLIAGDPGGCRVTERRGDVGVGVVGGSGS